MSGSATDNMQSIVCCHLWE